MGDPAAGVGRRTPAAGVVRVLEDRLMRPDPPVLGAPGR